MRESNNEDNKINQNERNHNIIKSKTFEMADYDPETRQGSLTSIESSENSIEMLNDSNSDFLRPENQYSTGIFVNYFDYFMSIFLFINSHIFFIY